MKETTELPWLGFEPTTHCVLGRCSTKVARLAESNPACMCVYVCVFERERESAF